VAVLEARLVVGLTSGYTRTSRCRVERAELIARIRPKVVDGRVQTVYPTDSVLFRSHGDGQPCRGCDQSILGNRTSIGYLSNRGERHWFHVMCDAIRRSVVADVLNLPQRAVGRSEP